MWLRLGAPLGRRGNKAGFRRVGIGWRFGELRMLGGTARARRKQRFVLGLVCGCFARGEHVMVLVVYI